MSEELITNIEKINENFIRFSVNNINLSFVNSLRRIILSEIDTIGFNTNYDNSDISVINNDSQLHNEFVLHRIGLLPIHITDIENFDKDRYEFEINITNETQSIMDITTEHFRIKDTIKDEFLSYEEKKQILPPSIYHDNSEEYILITRLNPNSENNSNFHIKGKASIGCGQLNSRWSCVSQSTIINKINYDIADEEFEKKIIELNDINKIHNKPELNEIEISKLRKSFNNHDIQRCFYKDELDNPNKFIFSIESIGIFSPEIIINKSLNKLDYKLDLFLNNLNDYDKDNIDENSSIIIENSDSLMTNCYDIFIKNEDDTIGNLLQNYIYNLYVLESNKVKFIGYNIPHPLENKVLIRIGLNDISENYLEDLKDIFNNTLKHIKIIIKEFNDYFDN